MRTALYPGSFNPWHKGHEDVLQKACKIFDIVLVCRMPNFDKGVPEHALNKEWIGNSELPYDVVEHKGLMVDAVVEFKCDAVIRGLRNGKDLEYEANLMYWNQDLGLTVPVVCFISEQHLSHLSSSAMRALGKYISRLVPRYQ